MSINKILRAGFVAALSLVLLSGAARATVLIANSTYGGGAYDISGTNMDSFRGLLSTATGSDFAYAADLSNAAQVASADALVVQLRGGADTLSAAEVTNISAFIASGKRVYLGGENEGWTAWNNSLLSLVGGTQGGGVNGIATTVYAHALTAGVATVNVPAGSIAVGGGTSLFDLTFANLWGVSENVLSVQDVNWFSDGYIGLNNNLQFATNVADWLAGSTATAAVPEPGTLVILALGLAGLGFARRRKQTA